MTAVVLALMLASLSLAPAHGISELQKRDDLSKARLHNLGCSKGSQALRPGVLTKYARK
jgi:hypothetical protein